MRLSTPPRFILDGHLGELAVKMRMAGIDTDYVTQRSDARIVDEAQKDDRIVLTRDIGLLKHMWAFILERNTFSQLHEGTGSCHKTSQRSVWFTEISHLLTTIPSNS